MLKRHIAIRVFVVYIDTGSPVPNIPSKSCGWQTKINSFLRNGNDSKQPYYVWIINDECYID